MWMEQPRSPDAINSRYLITKWWIKLSFSHSWPASMYLLVGGLFCWARNRDNTVDTKWNWLGHYVFLQLYSLRAPSLLVSTADLSFLSVMPRRYQAIWGFGVVSVLSSDTMGQSPSRVLVHWHTRFGPEPTHGPDTAYPQFRPLKKAIFSTAASPPFWIAETWFLLRNLGYYSPLKPCSESGHFRKFLYFTFWNPWISRKKKS